MYEAQDAYLKAPLTAQIQLVLVSKDRALCPQRWVVPTRTQSFICADGALHPHRRVVFVRMVLRIRADGWCPLRWSSMSAQEIYCTDYLSMRIFTTDATCPPSHGFLWGHYPCPCPRLPILVCPHDNLGQLKQCVSVVKFYHKQKLYLKSRLVSTNKTRICSSINSHITMYS